MWYYGSMNADLLSRIAAETKRAPKEALIAKLNAHDKLIVRMALDPDTTFGVTAPDDDECMDVWECANSGGNRGRGMAEPTWDSWFITTLAKFKLRQLTGLAATSAVVELIQRAPSREQAMWAGRVINCTLRAGFDIKTFNKVFKQATIEKFSVQLADTYEGEQLTGEYFVQPKLDGNRVILIDGKAMSRNGKEYAAAQHIVDEFLKFEKNFFEQWVVDGEMMGNLGFDQSSGALRRLSEGGRKKAEFTYWVFDLIDRKEWEERKTRSLKERANNVRHVIDMWQWNNVKVVPTVTMKNPTHAQLMKACDDYLELGFEGAMVKEAASPYQFKRAKNLLKVKRFYDADLAIVDFYEGKGKHKGRLGGIVVEGFYKNKKVRSEVGSGFDDMTREKVWAHRSQWKGAVCQIQFQEVTPDGSLRFPVFIMRRKDKE